MNDAFSWAIIGVLPAGLMAIGVVLFVNIFIEERRKIHDKTAPHFCWGCGWKIGDKHIQRVEPGSTVTTLRSYHQTCYDELIKETLK